jgi:hypothetical protein
MRKMTASRRHHFARSFSLRGRATRGCNISVFLIIFRHRQRDRTALSFDALRSEPMKSYS